MLRESPRILCLATLRAAPLAELVGSAALAGFAGVTLRRHHVEQARAAGLGDDAIRELLQRLPLGAVMIEALTRWPADVARDRVAAAQARALFECAVALDTRDTCAVLLDGTPWPRKELVRAFRSLCRMAAGYGLRVALEFVPWSVIGNPEAAIDVVERAGCANGGLLLDSWHWARSNTPLDAPAALDPARVFMLQLSDAPARPAADLWHETMHERLLPGVGTIDLARLLAALERRGVACPLAAEVFSDRLSALEPAKAARELAGSLDVLFLRPS
ncbi:MAG: sugar phosphate isomerase/epimerase [Pseudomonadales bacterium]|jgi:sugar phosphate isomerase/epimerase|nr:sugar phosphate isomerase/epimerase [Gammaproteobacteria bacterium]MBP6481176.1 sugar phosphate isomerase/epimerase [Pseudomonadales bacterium]MBP7910332.1 sugar phosphate isomerase/epimerase [Pseudomonadales bacterium]